MKGSGRQLVYEHLQEALLYYTRYKCGDGVPHLFRAYLETLEEDRAVEGYVTGLAGSERKAVSMYLAGKRIESIRRSEPFVDEGISMHEIRKWIYGDRVQFGLVNTMFGVMMRSAGFCPFCHDQKRFGAGGHREKLHGSVCPHREIWERERLEEMDG